MKIRVKVPNVPEFYSSYAGTNTTVDVLLIRFGDGQMIDVAKISEGCRPEIIPDTIMSGIIERAENFKPPSLASALGEKPSKITIEF